MNINNNNTFLSLAETFAGFQENPTSGQNNPTASSGSSINFNGTGTRGATFQINGVNNDDSSENQNRQGVSLSTIKEFQVISNSYTAEFGRGYGAVVLVQTKSGTNQVHGEVSFIRQDSEWNAMQAFATDPAEQPAAQLRRRRRLPGREEQAVRVRERRARPPGRQRRLRAGSVHRRGEGAAAPDARQRHAGEPRVPGFGAGPLRQRCSRTTRAAPGRTRRVAGFDQPDRGHQPAHRLEHHRPSDRLTGRYQYSRQKFDNEDIIVGETTQQINDQPNFGLTWTHSLTSRAVGEFRYGLGVRDTNVNIKAGNDTPIIRFAGSPVSGLDHRQRRQLSHPSRPEGPSVRLQPDRAARRQPQPQGGHRRPAPAPRRSRRQLHPRLLDASRRLRRHDLSVAVGRVPGRLRHQLHEGVRAVRPGEPHQRVQLLRRGQLADRAAT